MPIMAPGQQIPPQQIQMVPIPNLAPGAAGAPAPAAAPPPALASFKDQGALRAGMVTSALFSLFAHCRSKMCTYLICLEGNSVTPNQEDVILFRSFLSFGFTEKP